MREGEQEEEEEEEEEGEKKKNCRFVSEGEKVGSEIKQAFDISVVYKGERTLGRTCR